MGELIEPKKDARGILLTWLAVLAAIVLFNVAAPLLNFNKFTIIVVNVAGFVFAMILYYVQKGVQVLV